MPFPLPVFSFPLSLTCELFLTLQDQLSVSSEVTPTLRQTAASQLPNCSAGIFQTAFILPLLFTDMLVSLLESLMDSTAFLLSESSVPRELPGTLWRLRKSPRVAYAL